jgi:hypothetical protein
MLPFERFLGKNICPSQCGGRRWRIGDRIKIA